MKMEELPPSETSKSEKNSPTTTKSKDKKADLKVLNFAKKEQSSKQEARENLLDLLGVVASDLESGIDFDVLNATCGIVILANPDSEGEGMDSLVTVYTTKTNPMKILGVLEFVKLQISEQNSY
jgi:hypothetical protein